MTSSTVYVRKSRLIHMGYGITHDFFDQGEQLKPYLIKRLIQWALQRISGDLKELVTTKQYAVSIDCIKDDENQSLNDATYQVNFTNPAGLRISVEGIFLDAQYLPLLDHGFSIAENQSYPC